MGIFCDTKSVFLLNYPNNVAVQENVSGHEVDRASENADAPVSIRLESNYA